MYYIPEPTLPGSFLDVFLLLPDSAKSSSELEEKLLLFPSRPRWGVSFFPFTRICPLSFCRKPQGQITSLRKLCGTDTCWGQPGAAEGQGSKTRGVSSTSGEGRSFSGWSLRGLVSSLWPRMVRRCLAMTACCSTEQWFSKDRIRGYGEAYR